MPDAITVRVPATSANLGPGFDCLGLALNLWGTLTFTFDQSSSATHTDPAATMAAIAFRRAFSETDQTLPTHLSVSYDGAVPVGRGLGVSALSRVAGLIAANALHPEPLPPEHLLTLATELEGHADNATPALFGGLQVVVRDGDELKHIEAKVPPQLQVILFIPHFNMPTEKSRMSLPTTVSLADAVQNISRATLLVASLAAGRLDLLDAASRDRLHQPTRSRMFPAMEALFQAAREAGALCTFLSGAGSTICAFGANRAEAIATAMVEAASERNIAGETVITTPSQRGGAILDGS